MVSIISSRLCYRLFRKTQPFLASSIPVQLSDYTINGLINFGKNSVKRLLSVAADKSYEVELDEIVRDICKDNILLEKKLRMLMLEVEVMRQDGRKAPEQLTRAQWSELLIRPTQSSQRRFLEFLFKIEKKKANLKVKKEEMKIRRENQPKLVKKEFEDDLEYGLLTNTLLPRIHERTMDKFYNLRAIRAYQDGQPIILDCSYYDVMEMRDIRSTVKQLTQLFSDNRRHREPFALHLCEAPADSTILTALRSTIPTLDEPDFPIRKHEGSYLELFSKKDLVYLTPHCKTDLTHFNHDSVYIIGAFVDKGVNQGIPMSMAKAKREGIKMAKLPLDRYLTWGSGSDTNLPINHVMNIMLDLKMTSDWEYALRHIPRRKLMEVQADKMINSLNKTNNKFYKTLKEDYGSLMNKKSYVKDKKGNYR